MANQQLILPSYAKINRFLHITGRLANGYHKLQTLMQFIDLKDTLTFELIDIDTIEIKTNKPVSDLKDNLIYRATMKLKPYRTIQKGVHITLDKQIPMGGGLGGGSSNAATTLMALNYLWQCHLTKETLLKFGSELGADVPLFIFGKTAWAEGIGEKLQSFNQDEPFILIFAPPIHIATKTIFQHPSLKRDYPEINPDEYSFETTENAFEAVVKACHPEIKQLMDEVSLEAPVRLTGSGACFYALCQDFNQLKKLQKKFNKRLDTIPSKALNYAAVAYDDL